MEQTTKDGKLSTFAFSLLADRFRRSLGARATGHVAPPPSSAEPRDELVKANKRSTVLENKKK